MKKQWHKKVLNVLQWPAIAVGTVATAVGGVSAANYAEVDGATINSLGFDPLVLPNTLNSTAQDRYAAHRSHASHASHRSSGGGGIAVPRTAPKPSSPPPYTRPQTTTPTQQDPKLSVKPSIPKPSSGDISGMVVRVQAALMRLGYFNGDIDGVLGPETRSSITKYQKDKGLTQTGRMDIETLTALGITI